MKFKKTLISISSTVALSATYLSGYLFGNYDATKNLLPQLTISEQVNKALTKEAIANKKELDSLYKRTEMLDELLAKPVVMYDTNIKFSNNVHTAKFEVSAYSPYDDRNYINADGNPNDTATGTVPGPGTFAVDPDVIPYGSKMTILYPDGTVEHGVAEDTGSAIRGEKGVKRYRVDVFRYSFDTAMEFGMKDAIVMWEAK